MPDSATFTTLVGDVTVKTWADPYACPICGKPRPWHVWFSKDGCGCYHPKVRVSDAVRDKPKEHTA